jgi:hypothetical protein
MQREAAPAVPWAQVADIRMRRSGSLLWTENDAWQVTVPER